MSYMLRLLFALVIAAVVSWPLAAQPALRITVPHDRTVVHPGDTVVVKVSASRGTFLGVTIIGEKPLDFLQLGVTKTPYDFSIKIPKQISPRLYTLTATGNTGGKDDPISSNPVSIDVERRDSPQSVTTNISIAKVSIGERIPITVIGTYSDGPRIDLSNSTRTTYRSQDPSIAAVTIDRVVTGVSEGSTNIAVHHEGYTVVVKATVQRAPN
jgi:hypothetical protein